MDTFTVQGYYGSGNTPCNVICCQSYGDGPTWYAVEGSVNVNLTYDEIELGVNVEGLSDVDAFTWPDGVDSEQTLIEAVAA